MFKIILSILFVTTIFSINEYTLGSNIKFQCKPQGTNFQFKPMRQFTLFLERDIKNQNVMISVNKTAKCTLRGINGLCTLGDLVKQVTFSCAKNQQIQISIAKAQILAEGQRIYSTQLVQVVFAQQQRGQINIRIDGKLAQKVKTMNPSSTHFGIQLFRYSDCVHDIALFENKFKIAVKKTQNECTLGLKNYKTNWLYKKSSSFIQIGPQLYHDYLGANETIIYQVNNQSKKYVMQVLILNDNERDLDQLQFTVTFINKTGGESSYKIINFQKGLEIFESEIVYLNQVSQLKLSSNINIFFKFSFNHSLQQIIILEKDQYLFTNLTQQNNYSISVLIELQQFSEQKTKPKTILIQKLRKELSFNTSYAQCLDQSCQKHSNFKAIKDSFMPICDKLYDDVCIIKLQIQADHNQLIGILPYVQIQKNQLQINKIKKGILRHQEIEHFMVPKSELQGIQDEITIQVVGAQAFMTYQKSCRRISCCQYKDLHGFVSIPNKQEDLYVILKGTKISHYTFSINTKQKQFILENAVIHHSQIQSQQDEKYYTFKINNINKNIQINCNAAHDSLFLLVNTHGKDFPTLKNYTYLSKDCYINLQSKQLVKNQNIHITLIRIDDNQQSSVPYTLVAYQQNTPIFLTQNIPYFDHYQKGAKKIFQHSISFEKYQNNHVFFKLDINQNNVNDLVLIQISTNTSKDILIYNQSVTKTIQFTPQIMQRICDKQPKICNVFIKVQNIGKTSLDITVMVWLKDQAIRLTDGYFINFQTGLLGDQSHFNIQVKNVSKPINIYIYSNQIQLETITRLWKPVENTKIPYPSFSLIDKQRLDKISYSFSSSVYYSVDQLKQLGENGLILITLRDRQIQQTKKKLPNGNYNKGMIKLIYTTGNIQMHQDDRLQFELKKNQQLKITFDVKKIISTIDNTSHELYLHLTNLVGSASIKSILQADTYNDTETLYQNPEFLFSNLIQIKEKLGKMTESQQARFVFTLKCNEDYGRFLLTIVTTNSDYRQLTLGIPQQFYVKKNSAIVFQFIDFYNEDFKIKLNRRQGFPQYKIRSCNLKQDQGKCINQLKNRRAEDDPNHLIVSGRSHQLEITKQSQHYCKGCRYYFAFYSFNQILSGSITITRPGLGTLLVQGKPVITQVYEKEIDEYRFKPPANRLNGIIATSYMGQIQVQVFFESLQNGRQKKSSQNGQNVNIEFASSDNPQQIIIKVNSRDGQTALYSIMFQSHLNPIQISDGLPLRFQNKNKSETVFSYMCQLNSRLIIISNVSITSYISCSPDSKIKNLQKSIELKQSIASDKINFNLKKDQCSKFNIVIQNDPPADFTLLVNGEDIIMLPYNTLIPTTIQKSKSQIYQIPIQQKAYLKIVLQVCDSGNGVIGFANSKSELLSKDYETQFQLTHDKFYYTFDHTAKPGFLYIEITAKTNKIQYSIEVFPFNSHNQVEGQLAYLQDEFIQPLYLRETKGDLNQFQLSFSPLKIESKNNYTVNYVIIQSNKRNLIKKIVRCHGQYMILDRLPDQIINQYRVVPLQTSNQHQIVCKFQTRLKLSYLSIIAVPTPKLPPYVLQQNYQIIQIVSGNANIMQRLLKNILVKLQNITHIQDEGKLSVLLIMIIILFNLCFILISCYICSKYCRSKIQIRHQRLSTRERFTGKLKQNSLDMIQRQQPKQSQLDLYSKRQP